MRSAYKIIRFGVPNMINKAEFHIRRHKVGKGFTSYGRIFIRGKGQISIGEGVTITSCRETNPIGGDTKTILYAKTGSKITIGNHTGISNCAIVSLNDIVIGDHVMIGGDCKIYDHDFHSLQFEERMQKPDPGVKSAPIAIKDGAFIGAHCIILKGVTIGEKSVVAAGSIVTKSIPELELWGGAPARFIRKL